MIEVEGLVVPVIKRECLARCEQGPVMRISPGGKFFTEINDASLQSIIDELKTFITSSDKGAECHALC
jgi:(2Fe-2S) ferredoxin